jgi:hypothetical protein
MIWFTLMLAIPADFGAMLVSVGLTLFDFYCNNTCLSPCRTPEGRKIDFLSCEACARLPWEGREVECGGRRTSSKVSMSRCLVSFHH